MGTITAKQLKQKTGEIIKRIRSGEQMTLTYRGKPVAVITPSADDQGNIMPGLSPFEEAWRNIETALQKTEPRFQSWQEATDWVRNRS